jgi:5-methylcytosine-specific restriction enzyme subunit McrC
METILGESVTPTTLNADLLDRGTRGLNRLTSAYESALTLIRLLWHSQGVSFSEGQTDSNLPGFLFDMNRFFQAQLSRFLRDNLPCCTVRDEHHLRGMMRYAPGYNPRNRRPPVPRPDFVILRANRPIAVLDAKYRDLWDNPLPRDMLYQLAIYAVGHEQRAATILYPTTDATAQEARIGVTEPLFGRHLAHVCLRPVVMQKLGELIALGLSAGVQRRRTTYAEWLVTGEESASLG